MTSPQEALQAIWWLTVIKIVVGAGFGAVLLISLYKFKTFIMTMFGLLLLSNLVVLYIVLAVISK